MSFIAPGWRVFRIRNVDGYDDIVIYVEMSGSTDSPFPSKTMRSVFERDLEQIKRKLDYHFNCPSPAVQPSLLPWEKKV